MIVNFKPKRALSIPKIITPQDVTRLEKWIETRVDKWLSSNHLSFTCRDLFGHSNWNWNINKFPIQLLYDNWYQEYETRFPNLTPDEIKYRSFNAAASSVGLLLKRVCHNTKKYTFEMIEEFKAIRYRLIKINQNVNSNKTDDMNMDNKTDFKDYQGFLFEI